ncbi:hypothetical protein LB572_02940 [Mesorhizobium sp. BH1-1-5]|uniref:hypothetical protein n=1 Tax=Mesorhizobium sp. BH1-1-5 TaxID=2876661 RepID=UPI001CD02A62|nr:hypothetical protein [Mesorhizobium sp. BH1-1-5]MBZ9986048.1 hypothetical protein [Mesorhizobium sp. BH1-1-5]
MPNASQKIAENVLLLAVARISMALALPTIGLLFWLYSSWQTDQLQTIRENVASVQQSANGAATQASKLSERLTAVETKQVQDAASSEKFQSATLTRLDRVQDSIVGLSNAVAALTATLQAIEQERRTRPN